MQRVDDPADPRRCQGAAPDGQCMNIEVTEGAKYCLAHGGYRALVRKEIEDQRLYNLTEARAQNRIAELIKHDPTTFLYEVTAIAVLLLEKMERATILDIDFVSSYSDVNTLQMVIEKLKRATLHIQQNVTVLVSKASLYDFGRVLLEVAQEELATDDTATQNLSRIANQLHKLVRSTTNQEGLPSLEASQPLVRTPTFVLTSAEDAERLVELRSNNGLMSLYEEIAIQIIRLERRWNLVRSDIELLAACGQLTQGLKNLERLIKSAHEQAQDIGELLNPVVSRQVVLEMIGVVSNELKCLPNFETSIDRLRDRVMSHFQQRLSDETAESPSLELHE